MGDLDFFVTLGLGHGPSGLNLKIPVQPHPVALTLHAVLQRLAGAAVIATSG